MVDRLSNHFAFHQTALALRQQRQEILASNIANADTPNYKARDMNFSAALQQAMGGTTKPLPPTQLALTSARHIPGTAINPPAMSNVLYRQPLQPALDGNTVDMDVERMAFADNTLQYQASLQLLSQRIKGLLSAVQQ